MASSTVERTFDAGSPEALEKIAAALARNLQAGDRITLLGELGAGKTVFVRGLARGLGHPEPRDVVSPTFAIHNRYELGRVTLDHVDLYRLRAPVSWEREGLEAVVLDPETILCVEWSERLGAPLQGLAAEVRIDFAGQDARRVTLRAPAPVAGRMFKGL